jgi:protein gp37
VAANSGIEWTEATWNCLAGCEAVSPGCAHCYAATMTRRLEAMGQADYAGLTTDKHFNGMVRCLPHKLDIPLKRRKPTTYFVNSMSDLFHEDVPDEFIAEVFSVMAQCPQHTFQILTKRAERMQALLSGPKDHSLWHPLIWHGGALPNVWLGVSAEDQERADERIPWLLETPAAVRFVSAEPLLGPVDITGFMHDSICFETLDDIGCICSKPREVHLDWIIVGGESGGEARPCETNWIRSIVRQCKAAGVACFVKQVGAFPRFDRDEATNFVRDKKGGDPAEWPEDLRIRQMPVAGKAGAK